MFTSQQQTNVRPQNTLNLYRPPARLDAEQTAALLGFQLYEITLLVRARLLQPLGKPAQNSRKFFAIQDVEERAQNRQWLDTATKTVAKLVQETNGRWPSKQWPEQKAATATSQSQRDETKIAQDK